MATVVPPEVLSGAASPATVMVTVCWPGASPETVWTTDWVGAFWSV